MPIRAATAAFVAAFLALAPATPAPAEPWALVDDPSSFREVKDESEFIQIVTKGTLSRFGIKLNVRPDGSILGRAFGMPVRGAWRWREGYFCRDLYWGQREVGANCQQVKVSGNTLRFTSDQGQGRYADLVLR